LLKLGVTQPGVQNPHHRNPEALRKFAETRALNALKKKQRSELDQLRRKQWRNRRLEMVALRRKGLSYEAIGEQFGMPATGVIRSVLREAPELRGQKCYNPLRRRRRPEGL
jgi:hypothetical protein